MCLSMSTKTEISEHDYRMTKSTLSFLFLNLDLKFTKAIRKPTVCELKLLFYIFRILGYRHI